MNVLAVDPGPSSSGFYRWEDGHDRSAALQRAPGQTHYEYLAQLRRFVVDQVVGLDMALVEDYTYGLKGQRAAYSIEAGAVVREAITAIGVPVVVMPLSTWKAITIGTKIVKRGNARIVYEYLQAVQRAFGRSFNTTDEADAFMIYEAALGIWQGRYQTPAALRVRERMAEANERRSA